MQTAELVQYFQCACVSECVYRHRLLFSQYSNDRFARSPSCLLPGNSWGRKTTRTSPLHLSLFLSLLLTYSLTHSLTHSLTRFHFICAHFPHFVFFCLLFVPRVFFPLFSSNPFPLCSSFSAVFCLHLSLTSRHEIYNYSAVSSLCPALCL